MERFLAMDHYEKLRRFSRILLFKGMALGNRGALLQMKDGLKEAYYRKRKS